MNHLILGIIIIMLVSGCNGQPSDSLNYCKDIKNISSFNGECAVLIVDSSGITKYIKKYEKYKLKESHIYKERCFFLCNTAIDEKGLR